MSNKTYPINKTLTRKQEDDEEDLVSVTIAALNKIAVRDRPEVMSITHTLQDALEAKTLTSCVLASLYNLRATLDHVPSSERAVTVRAVASMLVIDEFWTKGGPLK